MATDHFAARVAHMARLEHVAHLAHVENVPHLARQARLGLWGAWRTWCEMRTRGLHCFPQAVHRMAITAYAESRVLLMWREGRWE